MDICCVLLHYHPLPSSAALSSMLPLHCHYYYSLLNTLLLCGRSSYSSHWTGRALFHEKINCANFAEPGSYLDTITQKNVWEILAKAMLWSFGFLNGVNILLQVSVGAWYLWKHLIFPPLSQPNWIKTWKLEQVMVFSWYFAFCFSHTESQSHGDNN